MAAQEQPNSVGLWSRRRLEAGIAVAVVLAVLAGVLVLQARLGGAPSASARGRWAADEHRGATRTLLPE